MNVSGNDVKVLGKVVSIAVDNIVADAEQVFDKNANLNQETINRNMTNAINQAVADVSSINTRVGSLEDAIDDKLNISDYQTYSTQMRESIMAKISEVEEEKQDVLTFDNTPTANSNNPVTSDGIKNAIDEIISYDSTYGRKTLESANVNLIGHPSIYLRAGGEWPEDAGEIGLHSIEGSINLIGDTDVEIRSGKQATTSSPIVGGSIDIETGGTISINGDPVKINGKDISSTIGNIFPATEMTSIDLWTKTPGIYVGLIGDSRDRFPNIEEYTTGIMFVNNESGTSGDDEDWRDLRQVVIDSSGKIYRRTIPYTGQNLDQIDWSTAPDFVQA